MSGTRIKGRIFVYDWHAPTPAPPDPVYDESGQRMRQDTPEQPVRIYGLTPARDGHPSTTCCLTVSDYRPHIYIELPDELPDIEPTYIAVHDALIKSQYLPRQRVPHDSGKPYMVEKRMPLIDYHEKDKRYMRYQFINTWGFRKLKDKFKEPLEFRVGHRTFKVVLHVHENNLTVVQQLTSELQLSTAGWLRFVNGVAIDNDDKRCTYEYAVAYKNLHAHASTDIVMPTVMSFDLECFSMNPKRMPQAKQDTDEIFQISAVVWTRPAEARKYLLTRGQPLVVDVGDDVDIRACPNETTLLEEFFRLVRQEQPIVFTGYNIFQFDIPYLLKRCDIRFLAQEYIHLGLTPNATSRPLLLDKIGETHLPTEGRVWIDLLHIMRRDFKWPNYKLDTAAANLLGAHKDPITVADIFRSFREAVLDRTPTAAAITLLGQVGKYCVVDSSLVQQMFTKLDVWTGIVEMAAVCRVAPSQVFGKGQQFKVFSQIVYYCAHNKYVVHNCENFSDADADAVALPIPAGDGDDEVGYVGAHVIAPNPALYHNVISMDFQSLYPSIMIAYNIDYSTLVTSPGVDDGMCHVIRWIDHAPCKETAMVCSTYADRVNAATCRVQEHRFMRAEHRAGVVSTIIQNLLDARKDTRAQIGVLKKAVVVDSEAHIMRLQVLDKRQWTYKIAANSMYGTYGVTTGYLPFKIGASCVTAVGRASLMRASAHLQGTYNTTTIYGDTDSVYMVAPHIPVQQLWDYAERIEQEMVDQRIFPPPMRLCFEDAVYGNFLILSKKRYMYQCTNRETGVVSDVIKHKGVLLARRNYPTFITAIYENLVRRIFAGVGVDAMCAHLVELVPTIFHRIYNGIDMNDLERYVECVSPTMSELISALVRDAKFPSQFVQTAAFKMPDTYKATVPAHVQLGMRMRMRGMRVDIGQRIEYVMVRLVNVLQRARDTSNIERIEDVEYQRTYPLLCPLDYLFYVHQLVRPIDQLLHVAYGIQKTDEPRWGFMKQLYAVHEQADTCRQELRTRFMPRVFFLEEGFHSPSMVVGENDAQADAAPVHRRLLNVGPVSEK